MSAGYHLPGFTGTDLWITENTGPSHGDLVRKAFQEKVEKVRLSENQHCPFVKNMGQFAYSKWLPHAADQSGILTEWHLIQNQFVAWCIANADELNLTRFDIIEDRLYDLAEEQRGSHRGRYYELMRQFKAGKTDVAAAREMEVKEQQRKDKEFRDFKQSDDRFSALAGLLVV